MSFHEINSDLPKSFMDTISQTERRSLQSINQFPFNERRISNLDDIKLAVREVYAKPFTPRTIRGHENIQKCDLELLLDDLSNIIYYYFRVNKGENVTEKKFDVFHNKICKWFVRQHNLISTGRCDSICYGKAQKEINMVFKYLTCYSDYHDYWELFNYCHMPIDSYVLQELKCRYGFSGITGNSIAKYYGSAWSNLSEPQYKNLLTQYRNEFKKRYTDYTCLNVEYYLWADNLRMDPLPID